MLLESGRVSVDCLLILNLLKDFSFMFGDSFLFDSVTFDSFFCDREFGPTDVSSLTKYSLYHILL